MVESQQIRLTSVKPINPTVTRGGLLLWNEHHTQKGMGLKAETLTELGTPLIKQISKFQ